jgi:hypothetical protein
MRQLNDYLDAAMARQNCRSHRELARVLGIGSTTLFNMTSGRGFPSDELMARIASLAAMDREAALLDLNIWRAPEGLARSAYLEIARRLGKSAAAIFCAGFLGAAAASLAPSPARAAVVFAEQEQTAHNSTSGQADCILWKILRKLGRWLRRRTNALIGKLLCQLGMRLSRSRMKIRDHDSAPKSRRFAGQFIWRSVSECTPTSVRNETNITSGGLPC